MPADQLDDPETAGFRSCAGRLGCRRPRCFVDRCLCRGLILCAGLILSGHVTRPSGGGFAARVYESRNAGGADRDHETIENWLQEARSGASRVQLSSEATRSRERSSRRWASSRKVVAGQCGWSSWLPVGSRGGVGRCPGFPSTVRRAPLGDHARNSYTTATLGRPLRVDHRGNGRPACPRECGHRRHDSSNTHRRHRHSDDGRCFGLSRGRSGSPGRGRRSVPACGQRRTRPGRALGGRGPRLGRGGIRRAGSSRRSCRR